MHNKNTWSLHLMILPGLILVLIYKYIPMIGIAIAFQDFVPVRGFLGSEWVGWDNFEYVYQLPATLQVVRNTIYIAVMKILANLIIPITAALLLNEVGKQFFKRSVQTIIYLPYFLSWVILASLLIDILSPAHGIVNIIFGSVGLPSVYWLGDKFWFPIVLVVSEVWKEFGFLTIIYLAAITSINPTLYEAASVDGAGRWRQTLHITLPGMLPIIVLMATLSLGNILNAGFEQVFNLYSPQVYETGDIIDTFVYRFGLLQGQYSPATVVGLFKSVVSFFFISLAYYLAYRLANYRIF